MTTDQYKNRNIEILVVAQLSVIMAGVMLYYFVQMPILAQAGRCQAQSPAAMEQSMGTSEQKQKSVL